MNLELGYGVAGFFCLVTSLIVGLGMMQSSRYVSREPIGMAIMAGALVWVSWLNWYPSQSDSLCFGAIAVSLLSTWAAWKDSTAATAAMRQVSKPG